MILRNHPASLTIGVGIGALGAMMCHHWMLEPPLDPDPDLDPDPPNTWSSRPHPYSLMMMMPALLLAITMIFIAIGGRPSYDDGINNPSMKDARPLNNIYKHRRLFLPFGFVGGAAATAASSLRNMFCNVSHLFFCLSIGSSGLRNC